jgi:hypothetical protein
MFSLDVSWQRILIMEILKHTRWLTLYNWTVVKVKVKVMLRPTAQSASPSWNKAPVWGLRSDFYYCQTVAGLLMLGAISDERMGVSFTISAGPRQRSFRNRVAQLHPQASYDSWRGDEQVHSHDFVWLLLVACTILSYTRTHMEGLIPSQNQSQSHIATHVQSVS